MTDALIFTDLDGTLLDHDTYSFEPALPALHYVSELSIPVIICTSKTRAETVSLREKLQLQYPFITENGGGIFIPPDCALPRYHNEDTSGFFRVIVLGKPIKKIIAAFKILKKKFRLRGFSDMSPKELASLTGLGEEESRAARQRDFSEPFLFEDSMENMEKLVQEVSRLGLAITRGGRFFHLIGPGTSKGEAVGIVSALYRKNMPDIITLGLGDSPNDLSMLQAVDIPVLVQKTTGTHDPDVRFTGLHLAQGVGPAGWNEAVLELVKKIKKPPTP